MTSPLLNDFFLERSLELLKKKKNPILTFQVPLAATSNASGVGAMGFEWLRKISSSGGEKQFTSLVGTAGEFQLPVTTSPWKLPQGQ